MGDGCSNRALRTVMYWFTLAAGCCAFLIIMQPYLVISGRHTLLLNQSPVLTRLVHVLS